MRDNCATVLVGRRVRLVPYEREHVPQYNEWMQDEELLRLTCSEPLSLEEEYANQLSWREEKHKVTFIVCHAPPGDDAATDGEGRVVRSELTRGMAGDVNAFLSTLDDEETSDDGDGDAGGAAEARQQHDPPLAAELEIMIADTACRRQGLARESLLLFVHWLLGAVPRIALLVAKVTDDNDASRRLFEGLGFALHKHMAVFEQSELRLDVEAARARCSEYWREVGAREHKLEAPAACASDD